MKRAHIILFVSGSLGLGHISRDLAVAHEIRQLRPDIEIQWLAAGPARMVLEQGKEHLIPQSDGYPDVNEAAAHAAQGTWLNIYRFGKIMGPIWLRTIDLFKKILTIYHFDLVVADEAFEISYFMQTDKNTLKPPYVEIIDFIGLEPMTCDPRELLKCYIMNWVWARDFKKQTHRLRSLFVGEPDDVPEKRFGPFLPGRRKYARRKCIFLGYILNFRPDKLPDRDTIRGSLGYGKEPLIICSPGGTSIGRELLDLCAGAYTLLKKQLGDVRMVLVCGPLISTESICAPKGVEIRGYVPKLYEHFAACDLAIVQGGGTSTLELTALNKPFLYFPVEGHFEQQHFITERLKRHGAGVCMSYRSTTKERLAEQILELVGKNAEYRPIPVDGAQKAALEIVKILRNV